MYIVGLTGGIGTGKSTASQYLRLLGAAVWDADESARAVVEPAREGWKAIRSAFGPDYFDREGRLLREKLATLIFDDPASREKLNGLLHPAIIGDMLQWLDGRRSERAAVAVIDAPLLFESGVDRYVDESWVLSCGVDEQVSRIMRRGMDREQAVKRVESQMSDKERRSRARRVIDTIGSVEDTQRHLKALYEEILEEAADAR